MGVELWSHQEPDGLRLIHVSVLHVGDHGVFIGGESALEGFLHVDLPGGELPLEIWVDGAAPDSVARVAFVLTTVTEDRELLRPAAEAM